MNWSKQTASAMPAVFSRSAGSMPSLRIKRWATEKAWRFSPRCMRPTLPCRWFF